MPIGRLPRGSSRLPGTYWCCLACELLLSAAWHSLVPFGLSAFPPEQCCSLARCPHLVSGTLPSRSAVSQPVHRDVFGHGVQSPTTAPLTKHLARAFLARVRCPGATVCKLQHTRAPGATVYKLPQLGCSATLDNCTVCSQDWRLYREELKLSAAWHSMPLGLSALV